MIPRPRVNLVLYYGVLGARAASRSRIVGCEHPETTRPPTGAGRPPEPATAAAAAPSGGRCWADLMQRIYGLDALACPRCGGRLRLVALIEERAVVERILTHLGVPTKRPAMRPARPPPIFDENAVP